MRLALVLLFGLLLAAAAAGDGIEWWLEAGEQQVFVVRAQETLDILNAKIALEADAWISGHSRRYRVGAFASIGRETEVGVVYSTLEGEPTGLQLAVRVQKRAVMSVPIKETPFADLWRTFLELDDDDKTRLLDSLSDMNHSLRTDDDGTEDDPE